MKIATVKSLAAKFAITSLAVGAFFLASPAKSQAQQFAVGVQFGHPTYVADRDDYRYDADRYRNDEYREHEQREAYARQQAYIAHERWEAEQREAYARRSYNQHEQREHARDSDRSYGYR
jgi:hypothetical protein